MVTQLLNGNTLYLVHGRNTTTSMFTHIQLLVKITIFFFAVCTLHEELLLTGGLYLDTADSPSIAGGMSVFEKKLKLYVMVSLIGCMVAVFDTDQ